MTSILTIISTILKWAYGIFKNKNTKDMKSAKINQREEDKKTKQNDIIEKRDTKGVQDALGE